MADPHLSQGAASGHIEGSARSPRGTVRSKGGLVGTQVLGRRRKWRITQGERHGQEESGEGSDSSGDGTSGGGEDDD